MKNSTGQAGESCKAWAPSSAKPPRRGQRLLWVSGVFPTRLCYQERFGFPAAWFSSTNNYWRLGRTKPSKNTFYKPFDFSQDKFSRRQYKINKNFLGNFCEVEDAKVFGAFCPHPKFAKHEKPNQTFALPLSERPSERGVSLSLKQRANGANTTNAARPSGRCIMNYIAANSSWNAVKKNDLDNL